MTLSVFHRAALNNFLCVKIINEIERQTTNWKIITIPGSCLFSDFIFQEEEKKMSCLTYSR